METTAGCSRTRKSPFIVSMATGEKSDPSSESILKSIAASWNSSEDRIALAGLGFAAIAAIWASSNLITVIDNLPFIPTALELVGILFSWWFIYRYLLFKPDRQELIRIIKGSISEVLGK
ncbi:CURVATURE THYLAKOID 1C protein [Nymphaea thermarum]|nr:CURVATURE THYLAKOID 1C protein [Nymphaea thermarum]